MQKGFVFTSLAQLTSSTRDSQFRVQVLFRVQVPCSVFGFSAELEPSRGCAAQKFASQLKPQRGFGPHNRKQEMAVCDPTRPRGVHPGYGQQLGLATAKAGYGQQLGLATAKTSAVATHRSDGMVGDSGGRAGYRICCYTPRVKKSTKAIVTEDVAFCSSPALDD